MQTECLSTIFLGRGIIGLSLREIGPSQVCSFSLVDFTFYGNSYGTELAQSSLLRKHPKLNCK
jgi:hypothetical protein